jgi:hypothetical protein
VIATSRRRCWLSLVCCLVFIAVGAWLLVSASDVQRRGSWLTVLLELAGIQKAAPGPKPPVGGIDGKTLKVVAGLMITLTFGLVALRWVYELGWRPRWVITHEHIRHLSGGSNINLELSLKTEVSSVELFSLREGQKPEAKPPVSVRPVLWLLSQALAVKHFCLGLRLSDPEGFDAMHPECGKARALAQKQFGVDLTIPVSHSPEEAKAIFDAVVARLQASHGGTGRYPL